MDLGDFVKFLILLLQEKISLSLKSKPWHMLFYKLKKEYSVGKPEFLGEMQFDWDGPYPESPELSHYLSCLCILGVLVTTSPCFQEYWLEKKYASLLREKYENLDEPAKLFLDNAVKIAVEEFNKTSK